MQRAPRSRSQAEAAGDRSCRGAPGRGRAGGSANRLRALGASRGARQGCRPSLALRRGRGSPTAVPPGSGRRTARSSQSSPGIQPPAANLLRGGYVTFHRGHCGCQEEQQQAIRGHRRPAAPRPSPSRGGRAGRAPRPGAPLHSPPVASPYPFALSLGPDSPERGVGVGGSVRAWGGAGARGCGCACVCVCLWERWVCACACV